MLILLVQRPQLENNIPFVDLEQTFLTGSTLPLPELECNIIIFVLNRPPYTVKFPNHFWHFTDEDGQHLIISPLEEEKQANLSGGNFKGTL